jgi:predicted ester cyclase
MLMSVKENRALMRRWFDRSNRGKAAALAVADETCAPDIIFHGITESRGLENYKRFIGEVYNAFPDKQATLDDMVVEGDRVAIRFTETGTQKGTFMGNPPTNRKVMVRGIEIDRVAGGKFAEIWTIIDTPSMVQLGLVQVKGKRRPAGR